MRRERLRANSRWIASVVIGVGLLAVTSRRWSATLLASALGMGLFIGVAFGPATDGVNALGNRILAMQGGGEQEPAAESGAQAGAGGGAVGLGGAGGGGPSAASTSSAGLGDAYTPPTTPVAPEPAPPVEEPADSGETTAPAGGGDEDDEADDPLTLSGTVVGTNPFAGSYTISAEGELQAIHAQTLPEPGRSIEVPARYLANGTYDETGERDESGRAESTPLNGFVTYVGRDAERPFYTLSARGASVLVRVRAGDSEPELPKLGSFVEATVGIEEVQPEVPAEEVPPPPPEEQPPGGGCVRAEPPEAVAADVELVQRELGEAGEPIPYFDVAATVQAICPSSSEIVLSADSIRQGEADMTVSVPKRVDLGLLEVDQPVLAALEVGDAGSLSMAAVASDESARAADDADQLQGDYAG